MPIFRIFRPLLRYYCFFQLKSPKTVLKEFDLNPRASGAQIYHPFTMVLFDNQNQNLAK